MKLLQIQKSSNFELFVSISVIIARISSLPILKVWKFIFCIHDETDVDIQYRTHVPNDEAISMTQVGNRL